MIIEVTHEGNGVFKVWPPPSDLEVNMIRDHILAIDHTNKAARENVSLFDGDEVEEAREAANDAEAKANDLEEALEEIKTVAENADENGAEETQKAIGEIIKLASNALF
jgi:hypothetical protein